VISERKHGATAVSHEKRKELAVPQCFSGRPKRPDNHADLPFMGSHDRRDSPRDLNVAPMTAEIEEPLAVSIKEAARRLNVSPATVGHMIEDKRLAASRLVGRAGRRGRVVVHVPSLVKLLSDTRVTS
jgi:excisionase family DNA binding protein